MSAHKPTVEVFMDGPGTIRIYANELESHLARGYRLVEGSEQPAVDGTTVQQMKEEQEKQAQAEKEALAQQKAAAEKAAAEKAAAEKAAAEKAAAAKKS
jgi:hypothetical protein